MIDDGDILEIGGRRVLGVDGVARRDSANNDSSKGSFLSVWFRCCHVYGRMSRNRERTGYEGRCPKCGAVVRATIGPGGTSQRTFEAF